LHITRRTNNTSISGCSSETSPHLINMNNEPSREWRSAGNY
jgi:hypothetical protein